MRIIAIAGCLLASLSCAGAPLQRGDAMDDETPSAPFPTIPKPRVNRDAASCLRFVDDLSRRHGETLHSDCPFKVRFAYCWIGAPDELFSCDKQRAMLAGVDPGNDEETFANTPRSESKRLSWVACETPGLPKISWKGNQLVNAGCN